MKIRQTYDHIPLDEIIAVELSDHHRSRRREQMKVRIAPHLSRKPPHGDCYVLWFSYWFVNRSDERIEHKGWLWEFGSHWSTQEFCREWKTLKGIVTFIEREYGQLIL